MAQPGLQQDQVAVVHTLVSAARTQPTDRHEVLILHWNVDYADVAHLIANVALRIDYSSMTL